jgi:SAM-dependent methyltransferase
MFLVRARSLNRPVSFDPIWEEMYAAGHVQRYPWDVIVSFVFRHAPRDRPRQAVWILEVGCGSASNLWFAAREGFAVAGIDGSASAIEQAKNRFEAEGLSGDLRVGDFTSLPFEDDSFDLAIDRGAIVCAGLSDGRKAIHEVWRVLRPGGFFFFNPYSDRHSSAHSGELAGDGLRRNIQEGTLVGTGQLCFYSRTHIEEALASGWDIRRLEHMESVDMSAPCYLSHAEWRVIAQKTA